MSKEHESYEVIANLYQRIDESEQQIKQLKKLNRQLIPVSNPQEQVNSFSLFDTRQLRENLEQTTTLNTHLYDKLSVYSKNNCMQDHIIDAYENLERKNIELSLQIKKLQEINFQLNQEKSDRLVQDAIAEQDRQRQIELQKQKEKEERLHSFAYVQPDSQNIRGSRQKNEDHLNKYKQIEFGLRKEIKELESDLRYVNKSKQLLQLQSDEMHEELNMNRSILAEKVKQVLYFREIEKLKEKVVKHNISDKHGFNDSHMTNPQSNNEAYLVLKKQEPLLRNQIKQKDQALVQLQIACDEFKRSNDKLLQQMTQTKQQNDTLKRQMLSANRLDKQACYDKIDQLELRCGELEDEILNKNHQIKKITEHPLFKSINMDIQNLELTALQDQKIQLYIETIDTLTLEKKKLEQKLYSLESELQSSQQKVRDHDERIINTRFEKDSNQIKMESDNIGLKSNVKNLTAKVYQLENQNQILIRENQYLLQKKNADEIQEITQQQFEEGEQNNIYKNISEWTVQQSNPTSQKPIFGQI